MLGIGLKEGAAQTTFDVTLLEETLASALSALDSSQAAQLALQQRVAELESQLSRLRHSADATTQTEFDVEGLEESLLLSALGGVQEATPNSPPRLRIKYKCCSHCD